MKILVLVDSNVFIGLIRRGLDPAEVLGDWIGRGDLATCGMVRMEVERGLRVEKIRTRLKAFFDVLINVPTNNILWERATSLAWILDRSGHPLPAQDILIATCARRSERRFSLMISILRSSKAFKSSNLPTNFAAGNPVFSHPTDSEGRALFFIFY